MSCDGHSFKIGFYNLKLGLHFVSSVGEGTYICDWLEVCGLVRSSEYAEPGHMLDTLPAPPDSATAYVWIQIERHFRPCSLARSRKRYI